MRTIGIIGAMEEEISFLREKMDIVTTKSVVGLTYYVGRYEGNNVVLVKSGIGKVNAAVCTQAMIDHFGVDYIINTGVARRSFSRTACGGHPHFRRRGTA